MRATARLDLLGEQAERRSAPEHPFEQRALAGVAAEFGVVMLVYLRQAIERRGEGLSDPDLKAAIDEGAVLRVRPKAMTVAVILAGLAPLMWSSGTRAEVMQRIAAPMIGGMVTAPLLSMLVIPAAYLLLLRRRTAVIRRSRAAVIRNPALPDAIDPSTP